MGGPQKIVRVVRESREPFNHCLILSRSSNRIEAKKTHNVQGQAKSTRDVGPHSPRRKSPHHSYIWRLEDQIVSSADAHLLLNAVLVHPRASTRRCRAYLGLPIGFETVVA